MTTKEQFIEMAKGITRPGIDQMMAWLETTDFYTAPASTRFHGAEEGGLCALFHDLCKISTYTVSTRNVKDDTTGQWTKVPFYKFEPKDSVGCDSHGSLSCYRIMATGMQLSMEEFAAVNNHMGVSNAANANTVWTCYEMHPLSWLLHVADEAATALDKI